MMPGGVNQLNMSTHHCLYISHNCMLIVHFACSRMRCYLVIRDKIAAKIALARVQSRRRHHRDFRPARSASPARSGSGAALRRPEQPTSASVWSDASTINTGRPSILERRPVQEQTEQTNLTNYIQMTILVDYSNSILAVSLLARQRCNRWRFS